MNMNHSPCYTCIRRSEICHAQCTAYHEWVAVQKKVHDNARKDDEAKAYAKENHDRVQRRRHLR